MAGQSRGAWTLPPSRTAIVAAILFASGVCAGPIEARDTSIGPVSFTPAQNWEGIDGSWNTFNIRVGTPPQTLRVQISTASQQTWVIAPRGCTTQSMSDCADNRGNIFYSNASTSWRKNGRFLLGLEKNLDLAGDADYGYDAVGLAGNGEGGPTIKNTTVGTFGATDFWFGHFGVNPKPTNFTSMNNPSPSYMTLLKNNKLIESLSFGYTAGAQYRFTKVLSSLTLGGYDASRFVANSLQFTFAPDNERDLVVAIQDVTSTTKNSSGTQLLPDPIYAYIDSTVPQIWLPVEACKKFEEAFDLTYDNTTDLYLLSSKAHSKLQSLNPNVTFTLAQGLQGGTTVDIVLPYSAFDMQASPPYQGLLEQTYYFPLRRASNESQYTLGRTFLQEAYLFVNWEEETFNVSQCSWVEGADPKLVSVSTKVGDLAAWHEPKSGGSNTGAIAGGAVGALLGLSLVGIAVFFFIRRRRAQISASHREMPSFDRNSMSSIGKDSATLHAEVGNVIPKAELDAGASYATCSDSESSHSKAPYVTMHSPLDGSDGRSPGGYAEADGKEKIVFEMLGDVPARQEAGGRQLSEKETMMVREARINGLDPALSVVDGTDTLSYSRSEPGTDTQRSQNTTSTTDTAVTGTTAVTSGSSDFLPSPVTSVTSSVKRPSQPRRQVTAGELLELSPFERDNIINGNNTIGGGLVSPISPAATAGHFAAFDFGPAVVGNARSGSGSGSGSNADAGISGREVDDNTFVEDGDEDDDGVDDGAAQGDGTGDGEIARPTPARRRRRRFSYE